MFPPHSRLKRARVVLLAGLWVVLAAGARPVHAGNPSRLTLTVQEGPDRILRAIAVVVDASGAPVAAAKTSIKVRTTFGWLTLVRAPTDTSGRVQAVLPPDLRSGDAVAEVGGGGQVRATVRFGVPALGEPAVRPGPDVLSRLSPQPGFISPYPVPLHVVFLVIILGGIWTTYGYMVWLLSRIRYAQESLSRRR